MTSERPRGRRAAGEGAREEILAAARAEFVERGYDAASVRGIARRADVDPALVRYYFAGGKPELFAQGLARRALDPAELVAEVLAGGPEGIGERLVARLVRAWDADGGPEQLRALVTAAASGEHTLVQDFLAQEIFGRIGGALPFPDARRRAGLAATQLIGLLMARHVLRLEPAASLSPEELAAAVGPVVQRYLTDGAPPGGLPPGRLPPGNLPEGLAPETTL